MNEVARLEREAEARRQEAGTYEEQASRKKTEISTLEKPEVPEAELRAKAQVIVGQGEG